VEARLRPVNALLGLMTPGDLAPPVLADAGFRVAGLEIPVGLESDRLVTDVLLVHDLTGHLLACKAKSGRTSERLRPGSTQPGRAPGSYRLRRSAKKNRGPGSYRAGRVPGQLPRDRRRLRRPNLAGDGSGEEVNCRTLV